MQGTGQIGGAKEGEQIKLVCEAEGNPTQFSYNWLVDDHNVNGRRSNTLPWENFRDIWLAVSVIILQSQHHSFQEYPACGGWRATCSSFLVSAERCWTWRWSAGSQMLRAGGQTVWPLLWPVSISSSTIYFRKWDCNKISQVNPIDFRGFTQFSLCNTLYSCHLWEKMIVLFLLKGFLFVL